jgi:hypothetical protein
MKKYLLLMMLAACTKASPIAEPKYVVTAIRYPTPSAQSFADLKEIDGTDSIKNLRVCPGCLRLGDTVTKAFINQYKN